MSGPVPTPALGGSPDRGPGFLRLALGGAGLQARAVFRILAAVAVGGMLLANVGKNGSTAATVVPLLAGLYVIVSTAAAWPRSRPWRFGARSRRSDVVRAVLDVLAVCAVAASVNEPRVAILLILCAIPLGYGLTLPASAVAGLTAVAVAGCLAVWAGGPVLGTTRFADGSLLLLAFALGWCGLVACLIAIERERRARRISKLSASVRDMLKQTLRAEANERTRVADLLHDDVLQILLATRHDISDAIDGDLDLLPDARAGIEAATRRLRDTIVALRDEGSPDQTVSEALAALAGEPDERGPTVDVDVSNALKSVEHPVLVAAARDLVRDAESSSAAAHVAISAFREEGDLVLVVRHDDRRFALGLDVSPEAAEAVGDVAARINALDGTLDVDHGRDGERIVTIRLPERTGRPTPAADRIARISATGNPSPNPG